MRQTDILAAGGATGSMVLTVLFSVEMVYTPPPKKNIFLEPSFDPWVVSSPVVGTKKTMPQKGKGPTVLPVGPLPLAKGPCDGGKTSDRLECLLFYEINAKWIYVEYIVSSV